TASCAAIIDTANDSTTTEEDTGNNPTIKSGSATVLANVLNLLNTNFINSPGGILFSNFTETAPTIDLRDASMLTTCKDNACSGQQDLKVNIVGDASIDNNFILNASSGENAVSNPEDQSAGTSSIETGDAVAGLNLVNIANSNFINSQYM